MDTIPLTTQRAFIYWDHFDIALEKTLQRNLQKVEPEFLETLIHFQEHYIHIERNKFEVALGLTLTAGCLRHPHRRHLYASAIGFYYNPRALKAAKEARLRAHRERPRSFKSRRATVLRILLENSGQIAFILPHEDRDRRN